MHRTSNAFSVLQATAAIVAMTIILWSVGLPSFRIAEAANVTSFSDTLSTSEPGVVADHEIEFTTPSGLANNQSIVVDFSDGPFVINAVTFNDIDVSTTSGSFTLAANCAGSEMASAAFSGTTLTITMCSGDGGLIAPNGTTTILIGENAGGTDQLTNPALGVYDIGIAIGTGPVDSGETSVAIVNVVTVTASVDTFFTFSVNGLAAGQAVNGTTTGGATTGTQIPLGVLDPSTNVASTAAQELIIETNARNGFTVTVQADGQLRSSNLADIDGFSNGSYATTPIPWAAPTASMGTESSYGHWGITSNDTDYFASGQYVSASTTPVEIWTNPGPTNGTTAGVGLARIGYTVQVSELQEAATDYQAILTYVATPVF